jgi:preprotein translocase subunit SecE
MKPVHALIDYLRSSKTELEKVSWPSKKDTVRYSSLVLGVSVVVALFFAGLDYGLGSLVANLLQGRATVAQPAPTETVPTPVNPVPGLDITPQSGDFVPTDVQAGQ